MEKTINLKLTDLIEEHENLIHLLRHTIMILTEEYNKQLLELEDYKIKIKIKNNIYNNRKLF